MIQVVTQMAGAKAGVTEYYASNGTWPRNNADIGLGDAMDISGKYMASLEVADGEVIASLQTTGVAPAIAGQIVTLTPNLIDGGSGGIAWKCSTTANAKYLPSGCFR
jgi:type IV pilus assembly protein PilA